MPGPVVALSGYRPGIGQSLALPGGRLVRGYAAEAAAVRQPVPAGWSCYPRAKRMLWYGNPLSWGLMRLGLLGRPVWAVPGEPAGRRGFVHAEHVESYAYPPGCTFLHLQWLQGGGLRDLDNDAVLVLFPSRALLDQWRQVHGLPPEPPRRTWRQWLRPYSPS